MANKGTRLVKPRLAHIAGVDHPAHQIEGFIVAKSLGSNDSSNLLEGLRMDIKEISKSLEAPLNKENAADVISALQQGVSFLISKAIETDEETLEKADGVKEAIDTNESHTDTDVTKKTKAEGEPDGDEEMTMEAKAKAYDELTAKKKMVGESEPDGDEGKGIEKALSSNSEFVAMKKQLNEYKAKELYASVEAEVKKAAGALQTNIDGFVKAVIAAGGTSTENGKAIIKSLKATAEQIAVGGKFDKEIGANGAPISSDLKTANSQLKTIAKSISTEEGIPMTQAFVEAAKRNPELSNTLTGGAN